MGTRCARFIYVFDNPHAFDSTIDECPYKDFRARIRCLGPDICRMQRTKICDYKGFNISVILLITTDVMLSLAELYLLFESDHIDPYKKHNRKKNYTINLQTRPKQ